MSGLQEESPPLEPLTLKGTEVERNDSYKFFGLHIKNAATTMKRAQQAALAERKFLQGVIKTAERVNGSNLPSMDTIYTQRCRKKAQNILRDKQHTAYGLFKWMDTGYNLRHHRPVSISTHNCRLHNSCFPAMVRLVHKTLRRERSTQFYNPLSLWTINIPSSLPHTR